jgi:very-short-patch-repair endonuclease
MDSAIGPDVVASSGADSIRARLDKARRQLLDLSTRNRLVHTPLDNSRAKMIQITDEISQQVLQTLVRDGKAMTFLPGRDAATDEVGESGQLSLLPQPADDIDDNGVALRHLDARLQTAMSSESLQKRLLGIYYDARTFEEEQGVNILFLALGFLEWYEPPTSDLPRYAPLILIPVQLERKTAGTRFSLRFLDEEVVTNLSIQAKLLAEFGIQLPDLPDLDELDTDRYCDAVMAAIEGRQGWKVHRDSIVLGFFSFAKFLMFRDLDPDTWPDEKRLDQHPLMIRLMDGATTTESPFCGEDEPIDQYIPPADMIHVVDCDSSQAVAIEEVRRGRNLVIQGPPGTGKSQTIANLIAAAVKDKKRVLFVAEKMAALEVVKRRLDSVGLGDMCLELHSNKVNKRQVVEEIGRTLNLDPPKRRDTVRLIEALTHTRDQLNAYAHEIHRRFELSDVTPYQVIGELVRLQRRGVQPQSFQLNAAVEWSKSEFRQRVDLLKDVVAHLRQIGSPAEHPWRGSQLNAVLPMDVARIAESIPRILDHIDQTLKSAQKLATELRVKPANFSPQAILLVIRLQQCLAAAPEMDRTALASEVWEQRRTEISELVRHGTQLAEARSQLASLVTSDAWTTDVSKTKRELAANGRSLLRWFKRDYRQAQSLLRGILAVNLPKSLRERLRILDTLIEGQNAALAIDQPAAAELGQCAFGSNWRGVNSDWQSLAGINAWEAECRSAKLPMHFRKIFSIARLDASTAPALSPQLKQLLDSLVCLFQTVELDLKTAFAAEDLHLVCLREIRARLVTWQSSTELLSQWIAFRSRSDRLCASGVAELAQQLLQGSIEPDSAVERLRMAYFETLLREMYRRSPLLGEFSGMSHQKTIERFRELDKERIKLASYEVAQAHFDQIPSHGGEIGEVGTIRREVNKRRSHKPLRKLLREAGHAIQAIKPVFMMSPVSVAQFLEPGALSFDLLLIDEASQVKPVDAYGAIARCEQLVIVGDNKQLPPTSFFDKLLADEADDDDGDEQSSAAGFESILDYCCGQGVPSRMLRWHYRSLHQSLIAVSNREFYDDRLYIVPSPAIESDDLGLRFRHIQDGLYDRGGSRTNRVEARAVAQAVTDHAADCPRLSLGVGAFSVAQRDAILDELEVLRRSHPELESFFAPGGVEPFFVKNLENIQGDERDVVFISVGYGRDASGYMAMSFGPLGKDGGERRLNVLISRAKRRCEVFSSITADDIDVTRTQSRGTVVLKRFLSYAHRGILDIATPTGGEYDSEFERQVAQSLSSLGYQVEPQVGIAGFRIDLAIHDPNQPGRYVLGIECDGATYHSMRSARDRDRLRQQVLEDRGWHIHRIWSTDWFQRPEEELRKTVAAIENARIGVITDSPPSPSGSGPILKATIEPVERDAAAPMSASRGLTTVTYEQARFPIRDSRPIHEVSPNELAPIVVRIVEVEGPVHGDEIARRTVELWGGQRTSPRMAESVQNALSLAVAQGVLNCEAGFYDRSRQEPPPIRNRANVSSPSIRRPEALPPSEIRHALQEIVRHHPRRGDSGVFAALGIRRDQRSTARRNRPTNPMAA